MFLVRQGFQGGFRLGVDVQNSFDSLMRERAIAGGTLQRGDEIMGMVVGAKSQDFPSLGPPLSVCFQQFLEEPPANLSQLDKALTQQLVLLLRIVGGAMSWAYLTLPRAIARQQAMPRDLFDIQSIDD